jgi:hypothetical protein
MRAIDRRNNRCLSVVKADLNTSQIIDGQEPEKTCHFYLRLLDTVHHFDQDKWGPARIIEDGIGRNLFESKG